MGSTGVPQVEVLRCQNSVIRKRRLLVEFGIGSHGRRILRASSARLSWAWQWAPVPLQRPVCITGDQYCSSQTQICFLPVSMLDRLWQILFSRLLFLFWLFGERQVGSSPIRDGTHKPPALESKVLTTGPPGRSLGWLIKDEKPFLRWIVPNWHLPSTSARIKS